MLAVLERPKFRAAEPNKFVIESNVPVPERAGSRGAAPRYPLGDMQVGDSFQVSLGDGPPGATTINKLSSAMSNTTANYSKRHLEMKFAVRRTSDTAVRVWRIA